MTRTADRMAFLALGLAVALGMLPTAKPATAQGAGSSRSSAGVSPGPFDLQLAIH